jgi:hypothetical protein
MSGESSSEGIGRVRHLLDQVEHRLEEKGDIPGPIRLFPWLTVMDLPRFLQTMRNEIRAVENGKGPIGYPVTIAVWEDLVRKLEVLAQLLSCSDDS